MSEHVSKNIFWLTASRLVALVLLFFAYAQLFRYLGPETYGQYQFVLSYVLIFSTVVDFGIQQFVTKKIAENPDEKQKYFHSFLAFEALLAIVLFAALLIFAKVQGHSGTVFYAIAVTGLGMVANAMCYPFLAVLSAFQDLRKVALLNFLNSLLNVSIIFAAIHFGFGIVFLALIQVCFGVMDLILYRVYIRKYLPQPRVLAGIFSLNTRLIADIIKSAWPFVLLVGFSAIYNRIDVVIITKLLGFEATGYYGAAYKIFDLLSFFPAVVSHSLFPHFASLMSKALIAEVRQNVERYIRLMLFAALPIATGGMLLSEQIIRLLAGEQFVPAAPVLSILIWAPALLFIYIPINSLVISQLTKKAAAITGANVVINIAGNIILLPIVGVKAAAIMTVASELLQGSFYFYFVRKNITPFAFLSLAIRPALAALVMGLGLHYFQTPLLMVNIALGAGIYIAALALLGFFRKEDVQFVKTLVKS